MEIDRIHPELRKATASFPKLPVTSRFGRALTRLLLPFLLPRTKPPAGVTIEQVQTNSGLDLRIYTPKGNRIRPALLYIHGGGMMIGAPEMDDVLLSNTATELDMVIVSPKYKLAPENPYPAALDDCQSGWEWMLENQAERQIDPHRIAIGGESAGGGLAAGLVLRLHDDGAQQPVAQWLFCPMLDDRTALDRSLDELDHFVWNNKMNLVGWRSYLGDAIGTDQVSAYAAPARRTDFRGLPRTWIGVGDVELFFEENKAYAEKLSAASVDCELDVVSGAPHAFEGLAPDSSLARDYLKRAKDWLRHAVAA
jgi:acetyl esterase/lipase